MELGAQPMLIQPQAKKHREEEVIVDVDESDSESASGTSDGGTSHTATKVASADKPSSAAADNWIIKCVKRSTRVAFVYCYRVLQQLYIDFTGLILIHIQCQIFLLDCSLCGPCVCLRVSVF